MRPFHYLVVVVCRSDVGMFEEEALVSGEGFCKPSSLLVEGV